MKPAPDCSAPGAPFRMATCSTWIFLSRTRRSARRHVRNMKNASSTSSTQPQLRTGKQNELFLSTVAIKIAERNVPQYRAKYCVYGIKVLMLRTFYVEAELSSTLELFRQPPQCFLYETCDRLVEAALDDCPIGRENTIGGLLPGKPSS